MGGGGQTQTSSPTIDPQIKGALLDNVGMANLITSGILPSGGGTYGAGVGGYGSTPVSSGASGISYAGNQGTVQLPDGTTAGVPGAPQTPATLANGQPYKPPSSLTADLTQDQLDAFQKIRNISNNPLTGFNTGADTFNELRNMQAPTVAGSNVTSKNFTDYDFGKYAQPYMSQVVDPVKSYFDQQSDRAVQQSDAAGRAAGALRGGNRDVGAALARGEIAGQAGLALSPLYQDAFKTSAGLIQNDAARDLQASQGNQTNSLQAGLANQSSALQNAALRANAATGMSNANQAARASEVQGAALLQAVGDQQQNQDQQKLLDAIKALQIRQSAITGALPSLTGQTTTTSGGGGGLAGILGGVGSLASGAGALGLTI